MRILLFAAFYPPYIQGGAELSAQNLAAWLVARGHEVGVLTTSPHAEDDLEDVIVDQIRMWRISMPRLYTVFEAMRKSGWRKPIWHAQDHFDPRNATIVTRVLDSFQPDLVNVHIMQGIGWNGLTAIGKRDLPTVFTLHDLSLACIRMAMFVAGKECEGLCSLCEISSKVKMAYIHSIRRAGFISPSLANLKKIRELQQIDKYPQAHILNANQYPTPTADFEKSSTMRFLYVGRLDRAKGIYLLVDALEPLAGSYDLKLTIVGSGPSESDFRRRCADCEWIEFTGHVSPQEVANRMAASDLLVVPSIWLENSPGAIVQALGLSLPVIASNKGGIPELVVDGENGILVRAGDEVAWRTTFKQVLDQPSILKKFRKGAKAKASNFDQNVIGNQTIEFFDKIVGLPAS